MTLGLSSLRAGFSSTHLHSCAKRGNGMSQGKHREAQNAVALKQVEA
jgi:hypothetical protein